MTTTIPICLGCLHYRPGASCDAFPKGIPQPIIQSKADHRQPFAGDRGVRFAPEDEAAAERAASIFREGADDHFYGAWKGGKASAGGHPAGTAPAQKSSGERAVAIARDRANEAGDLQGAWEPGDADIRASMSFYQERGEEVASTDRGKVYQVGNHHMFVMNGPDGEPAGFVSVVRDYHWDDQAMTMVLRDESISGVAIRPAHRGKGLATAMYDHLQDEGVFNMYEVIGASDEFTPAGRAFALSWLRHRVTIERERDEAARNL